MKLVNALLVHVWLAIRLKHNGAGLPVNIPGAFMLTTLYIMLSLTNRHLCGEISAGSLIALSFIAQFYIFTFRNKVLGLIILIGIITNSISLVLSIFTNVSQNLLLVLSILEFIMVFAALINVIKSDTKIV